MKLPYPRYLLVLACSRRKRPDPGLMPAIDRYDGVNYRVLRKAKREGRWPERLDLLILSARHGLLEPDTPIQDYDLVMTPERARQLRPVVVAGIAQRLGTCDYAEVFFNLGKTYWLALDGWEMHLDRRPRVVWAEGGIGQKAGTMLGWLREKAEVEL